jgi:MerR family transcriptional regulator, light-induced transcriptional regulator
MEVSIPPDLSIAAVERETGLSKDVLRKWETRYGFPAPLRDGQGERLYPVEQVNRLRLIKRLIDLGMRPSRIVTESEASLAELALNSQASEIREPDAHAEDVTATVLALLRNRNPEGLRQRLYRELLRHGLAHFVLDILTPISHSVGDAWARGELDIHEEHVYTEEVQWLLRNAIANLADPEGCPRVLLTTLPGEQHGLGILMAAALFSLHGAHCISLGTQTPVQDIARAAKAHNVDMVMLSFSMVYPQRSIHPALCELRKQIDAPTEIWAGGGGILRLSTAKMLGVQLLPSMELALDALHAWRSPHLKNKI